MEHFTSTMVTRVNVSLVLSNAATLFKNAKDPQAAELLGALGPQVATDILVGLDCSPITTANTLYVKASSESEGAVYMTVTCELGRRSELGKPAS